MKDFIPKRVYFEQKALDYPLGRELWARFRDLNIPLEKITSHNRISGIPGKTPHEAYREAKATLVVGVRKTLKFEGCKPSAHYQIPLVTSCPGKCEYCYLQTTLGKKPYIRIYVNQDEILHQAAQYIEERKPEITVFEGAATSDPLPVEPYGGALAKTIEFFGEQEFGRFRFVTKFANVDPLLKLAHQNHTRFRFSLNSDEVIGNFEHGTPPLRERIEAASKVSYAGYPLGFIIAPILIFDGWKDQYRTLLTHLKQQLLPSALDDLTFELITHRFTQRAKKNILDLFPDTKLVMKEEERRVKYGQFGYIKYLYPKEDYEELKAFFLREISQVFPQAKIEYFV
ncbi:spore photoproduct lyase [Candidatus Formimonas warabiya]|uniref:Spore photoproduct lyase n=1 Tax=Formimonas warabiya TaxID=1761012 RepID=A0A3G1KRR6_FORW1|nr:spore photoproduct lyase [Candidatus Formimonas warabiya]ATW25130.1 spore photoproduct lyase [Candidatus Formimonas warabiya]